MADALIWGASSQMAAALIQQLNESGWRVYAAARDVSRIPDGVYEKYEFEASDLRSIRAVAIDVAQQTDGLELWVYAAGDLKAELLRKMELVDWTTVLDANLNGAFHTMKETIHLLQDGSQAMFIGAYIDHLILPKMGAYAVAKAGLETLVGVLQKENRKLNFTLVKPGAVDTRFWENAPFRMPASAKAPQEVASAMLEWQKAGKRGKLEL